MQSQLLHNAIHLLLHAVGGSLSLFGCNVLQSTHAIVRVSALHEEILSAIDAMLNRT